MTSPDRAAGQRVRRLIAPAVLAVGALVLAGCSSSALGGGGGSTAAADAPIKIGYVTPQTGSLAAFGEADSFVLAQMKQYYADHPVTLADGSQHPVEILSEDTQSDSTRAAQVASDLIDQGVSLILVSSTPETTNPVSDQCESAGVPCISTVAPWQAWYFGRGGTPDKGFQWTYHFFWGLEEAEAVYSDIWKKAAPGATNVGALLPNDSDGNAWADPATGFPPFIQSLGLNWTNPGAYQDGSTDFSAQISAYKASNAQILMGVPIPPDFTTFWKQAVQQGYHPQIATIAKAILFPSAVEALGTTGNNLGTEVWWSPSHPFSNSLTGQSSKQLADAYTQATGKQWTQPLGYADALFEVATAALQKSASLQPADIAKALSTLKVDTIAGPVDFGNGPVPNVSDMPLVGGQWRLQPDGSYDLVIVSNSIAPEIPTGGVPEPIDWGGQ